MAAAAAAALRAAQADRAQLALEGLLAADSDDAYMLGREEFVLRMEALVEQVGGGGSLRPYLRPCLFSSSPYLPYLNSVEQVGGWPLARLEGLPVAHIQARQLTHRAPSPLTQVRIGSPGHALNTSISR